MTLTEFLTARLDEDEDVARRARPVPVEVWHRYFSYTEGRHFARHDPARVLAEVDAKRQILAWCSQRERIYIGTLASNPDAPRPEDFVEGDFSRAVDAVILRYLALPYADHPDYREEWRP